MILLLVLHRARGSFRLTHWLISRPCVLSVSIWLLLLLLLRTMLMMLASTKGWILSDSNHLDFAIAVLISLRYWFVDQL
jgi:hypothetical protein